MIDFYFSTLIKIIFITLFFSAGLSKISKKNYYATILGDINPMVKSIGFKNLSQIAVLFGIIECILPIILLFYIEANFLILSLLTLYTLYIILFAKEKCECGGVMDMINIPKSLLLIRNIILMGISYSLFHLETYSSTGFNLVILELGFTLILTTYALKYAKQILN
ncbi:hypothetical protein A0126_18940 (plasmid) [Exiguobacterium sp. N4-1P]|uniref:MauE/DoxX family redox-associated membrane protein n=1 Tax=Exiguobacterium sp. N4-1P TaxID=2051906 RepID=UPI000B58D829|nr:MauE/DoxX family redox-associated membrane protein [Exiguobacterium sp. N4-1P]ASI36891.1 hypothetical protein A0126_15260 [Exiguobacterium sp. N4-1P]ASI37664.1 hypothetical protein A0126_18940 [Exiguobacterium sp. N4-1P]